jgi:hypothetical protein
MALLEFNLADVESIMPWGEPGNLTLSWFALTLGTFHMNVGDQVLFQYSKEMLSYWGSNQQDVDYQIASIARDIFSCISSGTSQVPPFIERLASNSELLTQLYNFVPPNESSIDEDITYNAWRWLGERSPWTSYFVASPNFQFVRIGDDIHILWDNRDRQINEISAWSTQYGVFVLPLERFLSECQSFADLLLQKMNDRIQKIESGFLKPQIEVSIKDLRLQHENWRSEFASYLKPYSPDIPWDEAEKSIRMIAKVAGIHLGF